MKRTGRFQRVEFGRLVSCFMATTTRTPLSASIFLIERQLHFVLSKLYAAFEGRIADIVSSCFAVEGGWEDTLKHWYLIGELQKGQNMIVVYILTALSQDTNDVHLVNYY